MMPEWIDDSSEAPTVLVADGPNHFGSSRHSSFEGGIRIFDGHDNPHRAATESLGTEIEVLRRFIGQPELRPAHGQSSDDFTALVVDSEQDVGSERRLVELECPRPFANREQGGNRGTLGCCCRCVVIHLTFLHSTTTATPISAPKRIRAKNRGRRRRPLLSTGTTVGTALHRSASTTNNGRNRDGRATSR